MHVPPTGETGKGVSQLWVLTSYFRTRPGGCFLCLNDPNILLFVIFIEQWGYIKQNRFSTARDYNAIATAVSALRQDMLLFAGEQLRTRLQRTSRAGDFFLRRSAHTGCPVNGSRCDASRQIDGKSAIKCSCFVHSSNSTRGRRRSCNVYVSLSWLSRYTSRLVQRRVWYNVAPGTTSRLVQRRAWYNVAPSTTSRLVQRRAWYNSPLPTSPARNNLAFFIQCQ